MSWRARPHPPKEDAGGGRHSSQEADKFAKTLQSISQQRNKDRELRTDQKSSSWHAGCRASFALNISCCPVQSELVLVPRPAICRTAPKSHSGSVFFQYLPYSQHLNPNICTDNDTNTHFAPSTMNNPYLTLVQLCLQNTAYTDVLFCRFLPARDSLAVHGMSDHRATGPACFPTDGLSAE